MRRDLAAEVFARLTRWRRREHVAEVRAGHTKALGELRLCTPRSIPELLPQPRQNVLLDAADALIVLSHNSAT
jgi:hypothetical protein